MSGIITAILFGLLCCTRAVHADEWLPFRLDGAISLYNTAGPVQPVQHSAGQLKFLSRDAPVQLAPSSGGLSLLLITREQRAIKLPDKINIQTPAKWSVAGQIRAGATANVWVLPVYKDFYPYYKGTLYTPWVTITGDAANRIYTVQTTLKSPVRAKNDAFAIANSNRIRIASHPTPHINPQVALAVQSGYENALGFMIDPVILAAKADFASRTHNFPTCARELQRLIEHYKTSAAPGQNMPKRVQRAYYGRMTCLYKQAKRTQQRKDWLALTQSCHYALADGVKHARRQYFTTWYDALLIMAHSTGRQSELTAELYKDEILRISWTALYYKHHKQQPPPPNRDLRDEIKRYARAIGR